MKVCKECGEINKDSYNFCKNCFCKEFVEYNTEKIKSLKQINKISTINENIKTIFILLFFIILIFAYVVGYINKTLLFDDFIFNLFLNIISFLFIFFTDKITYLFLSLIINDYKNETSDIFFYFIKIIGIIIYIKSIYYIIFM